MSSKTLKQKSVLAVLVGFVFCFMVAPSTLMAVYEYQPLAPIPGTTVGNCDPTVDPMNPNCRIETSSYIPAIVKIIIQIAGGLAVIMIVIGGIQYITTDAIQGKEEGKDKIQKSVYGLLLVIASFILLQTINPKTLELELSITPITPIQMGTGTSTITSATTTPTGNNSPWPDDSAERAQLQAIRGVSINRPGTCTFVGEQSCTSVYGLGARRLNGITALSTACGVQNCSIVITGGTEYWLHGNRSTSILANNTSHKPEANGGRALDLSKNSNILNNVIQSFPEIVGGSSCANGKAYQGPNGAIYVDEVGSLAFTGAHWHVCF